MSNEKDKAPIEAEVVEQGEEKNSPGTEIKEAKSNELSMESSHDKLIEVGMLQGVPVEHLEKLFALKERHEANEAKKAYNLAMAGFREKCPAIKKNKRVYFEARNGGATTDYMHADLSGALEQIKPFMAEFGLSHSWRTGQLESGNVEVTCIVTHQLGHSEQTTLFAPKDDSGKKNSIQQIGSTITYLERYTLFSILGLAAAADDDGKGADEVEIEYLDEKQILELDGIIADNNLSKDAFLKWQKIASLSEIEARNFEGAKAALLKSVNKK